MLRGVRCELPCYAPLCHAVRGQESPAIDVAALAAAQPAPRSRCWVANLCAPPRQHHNSTRPTSLPAAVGDQWRSIGDQREMSW
jgi:hypothetical protein